MRFIITQNEEYTQVIDTQTGHITRYFISDEGEFSFTSSEDDEEIEDEE